MGPALVQHKKTKLGPPSLGPPGTKIRDWESPAGPRDLRTTQDGRRQPMSQGRPRRTNPQRGRGRRVPRQGPHPRWEARRSQPRAYIACSTRTRTALTFPAGRRGEGWRDPEHAEKEVNLDS